MPSRTKSASVDASQQDVEMVDAVAEPVVDGDDREGEEYDRDVAQKIKILPGATEDAASYEFLHEDHTLGNALRWMIMKNPEVEFCGYSIPHPSEPKMNIRIQTYSPYTPREALAKGLDDLMDLCDVVTDKFVAAKEDYLNEKADKEATGSS